MTRQEQARKSSENEDASCLNQRKRRSQKRADRMADVVKVTG